jgi:3-hydroxyacyl-[acyl-carrier-protein] dehydratase
MERKSLNINEIKEIIPHRYPFLLIDKIIDYEADKSIIGIKNITSNEEFFNGHFPDHPVMPGVLIIEALAQTGAVLVLMKPENKGKIAFFAGIDNVRFKRQVIPGDQIKLEIEVTKLKSSVGKCNAKATVDGELVCSGELMFMIN